MTKNGTGMTRSKGINIFVPTIVLPIYYYTFVFDPGLMVSMKFPCKITQILP